MTTKFKKINIQDLRRSSQDALAQLQQQLESVSTEKDYNDDRYWKVTRDSAGNGSALIRFLPPPPGENSTFVKFWDHAFRGPGGWYIERSLTTLGQPDPVAESNRILWNSSDKDDSPERKLVRERKRRLHYVSNILVIKDPAKPENNGKVFLFQYGQKIFDKIKDLLAPDSTGLRTKAPSNPFDFWTGRNFILDVRLSKGYPNYDKCEWEEPSPVILNGTDEEYEVLWQKCHSLVELVAPNTFKSYEELEKRLQKVLGTGNSPVSSVVTPTVATQSVSSDEPEEDDDLDEDPEDQDDFLKRLAAKVNDI